jgi:ABC-2 type transport system permease protein
MSLKRIGALLGREVLHGAKGFYFVFAIITPLLFSLVISLVFGTLFNEMPKLGIVDEGDSRLADIAAKHDSMTVLQYDTEAELKGAVESGAADVGLVLPAGFDESVSGGIETDVAAYVWGEARMNSLGTIEINIFGLVQELAGFEPPVNIEVVELGEGTGVPWNDRLLPFIVLMAVVIASVMLPALSVVTEKEKRTMVALVASPATLGEIFLSKGVTGVVLSVIMGVVVLSINGAFGTHPLLLLLVLALGAVMGSVIGLIAGALLSDTNSFLAFTKLGGIFLWAPAIVYMFPQVPVWIARVFPTYYIIEPVVEIVQRGGGWSDIVPEVIVLSGLIAALTIALSVLLGKRTEQQLAF